VNVYGLIPTSGFHILWLATAFKMTTLGGYPSTCGGVVHLRSEMLKLSLEKPKPIKKGIYPAKTENLVSYFTVTYVYFITL
jgi:hypothetical protein